MPCKLARQLSMYVRVPIVFLTSQLILPSTVAIRDKPDGDGNAPTSHCTCGNRSRFDTRSCRLQQERECDGDHAARRNGDHAAGHRHRYRHDGRNDRNHRYGDDGHWHYRNWHHGHRWRDDPRPVSRTRRTGWAPAHPDMLHPRSCNRDCKARARNRWAPARPGHLRARSKPLLSNTV